MEGKAVFKGFMLTAVTSAALLMAGCSGDGNIQAGTIRNTPTASASSSSSDAASAKPSISTSEQNGDPRVAMVKQTLDELRPLAKQCYDAPTNEDPAYKQCEQFIDAHFMHDASSFKIVPAMDAGMLLTDKSIETDPIADYRFKVTLFTPDSNQPAYRMIIGVNGDQLKLIEGDWLDAGQEWLQNTDYPMRWSR